MKVSTASARELTSTPLELGLIFLTEREPDLQNRMVIANHFPKVEIITNW